MKKVFFLMLTFISIVSCVGNKAEMEVDPNTICFYYNWYGNEETDGRLFHWAHPVLNQGPVEKPEYIDGKEGRISSNFYPEAGLYSCGDPETLKRQVKEMASAGIGVIALTWWKGNDFGESGIPVLMEEADKYGMKVCFHVEPYGGRTALSFKEDIQLIKEKYGDYPAFYSVDGKPMFFVYDSYLIPDEDWAEVLQPDGKYTIRGTDSDAVVVGLVLGKDDCLHLKRAGFDGGYSYFASVGFTEGSTPENWNYIQNWCEQNDFFFVPSVGPGYMDERIRPWNGENTRDREHGKYYERMFRSAIETGVEYIAITSFNEWHEGTQIEPAVPMKSADGQIVYEDYVPEAPDFYLKETRRHVTDFVKSRQGK